MRLTRAHWTAARGLSGDALTGLRLAVRLRGYFGRPITQDLALRELRGRHETRPQTFLAMARRTIYQQPDSPYLQLLEAAGCEYGDLERLVNHEGVEGALKTLLDRGVYLKVDEFKGRRPTVRGSRTFDVDPQRLRNPTTRSDIFAQTSGSRGPRTVTGFDLAFVRGCAMNTCLFLDARGGSEWVKADWEGPGGGAAFRLLKFNSFGAPPAAWFTRNPRDVLRQRTEVNAEFMRLGGRLAGRPFPRAIHVPHESPLPIAEWMRDVLRTGRRPHLYGFVSSIVRLCQAATNAGIDLGGAEFTLIGEPITAARLATISRSGASGVPRYGSIEAGPIGYGCLNPEAPDEVHVQTDRLALIQAGDHHESGLPRDAMFITLLDPAAPFLFFNVSMGDQAHVTDRACGCAVETWSPGPHLHTILSYEKLTAAGLTLLDTDIVKILEEVLPGRFGGVPTHYQLLEDEGADGQPRLALLVHPAVGVVDELDLIRAFRAGIGAEGGVWDTPGFLRVERRPPEPTGSGKILHLHLWRKQ
ncbi:MAG: hypothetical protein L0271_07695 [Gemmatimonadetes bacterium]|nr:hypothetical protein [Gemmatimonadota bacterium]